MEITIFTRPNCPSCLAVKNALLALNEKPNEINIDNGFEEMAEYSFLANLSSLPLIKIDIDNEKDPVIFEGGHEIHNALKYVKALKDEEELTG